MDYREENDGIFAHIRDWVELRFAALKLGLLEGLSITLGNLLGIILAVILGGLGLLFFLVVLTWLLGQWLGMIWALVAMGALMCILALIVWLLRQRIFGNMMVRMLSKLFFRKPFEP